MVKKINNTENLNCFLMFLFSVVFVFLNSKNSPLYLFNEWGDPNIYFSMGKGMMNGVIPYKDIFDHKGPLIFLLYGIGYLISNDSFTGVFILECFFLFVNLLFAYKIARLFLNDKLSFITGLCYSVLLFSKSYYGGSAEEFISAFVTVSFYYFIIYFRNPENFQKEKIHPQLIIHGVMCGLTFLIKLSVCVFWIPFFVVIFYDAFKEKNYGESVKRIFFSSIGLIMVVTPFLIYFALNNAFSDFYRGYIEFNSMYAEFQSYSETAKKLFYHSARLVRSNFISFPLVLIGLGIMCLNNRYIQKKRYKAAVILSFILLYITICMSKYIMTYAHMVIYIYAIFGVIVILDLVKNRFLKNLRFNPFLFYSVSFILFLSFGVYDKKFFNEDYQCLLRKEECNYMQKEFASIINGEKSPTLLDLGLDHGVFTKANIIPSYKYFFYPNISYNLYTEIRDYQTELIEKKEPMFIVFGDRSYYQGYFRRLESLQSNYELISVFRQDRFAFDTEVYLYKRKDLKLN